MDLKKGILWIHADQSTSRKTFRIPLLPEAVRIRDEVEDIRHVSSLIEEDPWSAWGMR